MSSGVRFVVDGVSFEDGAFEMVMPIDGMTGFWLPSMNAAKAANNLVSGQPDAVVVGDPTYFPGFVRYTGLLHFMETSIADTVEFTDYVVARVASDTSGGLATDVPIVGNYNGPALADPARTSGGSMMWFADAATVTTTAQNLTNTGTLGITIADGAGAQWYFLVSKGRANQRAVKNMTTGFANAGVPASATRDPGSRTKRIGSAYASMGGQVDIASYCTTPKFATDAEDAAVYERVKAILANRTNVAARIAI